MIERPYVNAKVFTILCFPFVLLQTATMSREAIYAASYLGGVPILRQKLDTIDGIKDIPGGPFLGAGISMGIAATVMTHPSDTIKTRQQAFPDLKLYPQYRTMYSTAQYIVQEGGYTALFAGLMPRAFRIIGAMFIFNSVKTNCVNYLESTRSIPNPAE